MASRQLFVLRHAKSSWDDPSLRDIERPLAPRGERAVELLAGHIRQGGIRPQQVLCSPALRARQTLEGLGLDGETVIEEELYSTSEEKLVERLRRLPEELHSVMVVGHNPTMKELVQRLAAPGSPELDALQGKYPTAALATLSFEGSWSDLAPGGASLTALVLPRDLH